jgi:hypothetical protein
MISYYLTIVAFPVGGSLIFAFLGHILRRHERLKIAEKTAKAELAHAVHRLDHTREELHHMQALHAKELMRCPVTFEEPFGLHRCILDGDHLGIHHDNEVAWYGQVQFPVPEAA